MTSETTGSSQPGNSPITGGLSATPVDLPAPAVGRMSLYFRELQRLLGEGRESVNSQTLGHAVSVSPSVVRRDLSALGTFGRRGVGYDVGELIERIGQILGSGMHWRVVLIGVGSLGHALMRYRGFEQLGFRLAAAFDIAPERVGRRIAGIEIRAEETLEQVLSQEPAQLAILTVPADQAAAVATTLVRCGVSGILNFAPTVLKLPPRVAVVNVDLARELHRLAFNVQSGR